MICRSFACATSSRVVDSLASADSLVWFMNCLVVFSLLAMVVADKPLFSRDHTIFCFWVSGDAKV